LDVAGFVAAVVPLAIEGKAVEPRQWHVTWSGTYRSRQNVGAVLPLYDNDCRHPLQSGHPSFYKHLRDQGNRPKVAIVAAMRKLITTANAMLAHDRSWHADPA
jgi:hypothetical protein